MAHVADDNRPPMHPAQLAWAAATSALEAHGWKLLAALVLGYVLRDRYQQWAADRRLRRSLADANGACIVARIVPSSVRVDARWGIIRPAGVRSMLWTVWVANIQSVLLICDRTDPARVATLSRDAARVREQQQRTLAASTKSRRRAT